MLGRHCSDREQRAEAAERELTKLKLLAYLSDRIGEEMDAVVTGVESFGLFVQGVELPAEGLVRVDALSDDYYPFDRGTHTLTGRRSGNRYRLGDCCGWPSPGSIWNAASWISASWPARPGRRCWPRPQPPAETREEGRRQEARRTKAGQTPRVRTSKRAFADARSSSPLPLRERAG